MKKHIAEELPARKFAPAAAPAAAKGGPEGGGKKDGKSPEERIRQAVYDIRYRARREDVPLVKAFSDYMSNSSLGGNERAAVKKKLFGDGKMKTEEFIGSVKDLAMESVSDVMVKVFTKEAIEAPKKYKVRVEDKSGKSYVRYADREKITELRGNPNIRSVEITSYGEPYEGERKQGRQTAAALGGGEKATQDFDHDGKVESSSKEHAGAVHNAIQRKMGGKPDGKDTRKSVEEAHKPGHKKGKKGDGNLANNYPPYDKVTRGDIVAGALGQDQKGGKVEEDYLWTEGKQDKKKVDTLPKGESNKVKVFPSNMTEKMDLATADMGDVIKDFRKSKKKQFKGKSKKKKQEMAIAAKLEAERKAGMKEEYDSPVDRFRSRLDDESKKKETAKKEKEEMDIRSLPTAMNLFKNKMRSIGLKCSNELEGEQLDEMLPALALGAGLLAAPAIIKAVADKPVKKALDNATKNNTLPLATGGNMQQLRQAQNNSFEPEGEVVSEEESDARRDKEQMEKGMDRPSRYAGGRNPNRPAAQTGPKKKPTGTPDDAFKSVVASLQAQHGPNAVMASMRTRKGRQG